KELDFVLANTFTDQPFGGNKLVVFPAADGIAETLMPVIARELSLGDTVFVRRAADPSRIRDIRLFSPEAELPFAGPPTVGAAMVLINGGFLADSALPRLPDGTREIVLGEKIGPVPVRLIGAPKVTEVILTAPRLPMPVEQPLESSLLADVLGLAPADIASEA